MPRIMTDWDDENPGNEESSSASERQRVSELEFGFSFVTGNYLPKKTHTSGGNKITI